MDNKLRVEIPYDLSISEWARRGAKKRLGTIVGFIPGSLEARAIIKMDDSNILNEKFLHEIVVIEDDYIN